MRIDIIERVFNDRDKPTESSLVIGLDKELTFYVYTLPDFYRIYTGKDEKEAFKYFKKHKENRLENGGESEYYI